MSEQDVLDAIAALSTKIDTLESQVINLTAVSPIIISEDNLSITLRSMYMPNMVGTLKSNGNVNFSGKQGSTWLLEVTLRLPNSDPYDISNCTFASQLRKKYNQTSPSAEFVCTLSTDGTDGKFEMEMDADTTTALTAGNYFYDVEMTDGDGNVTRLIEGKILVDPETTKAVPA